MGQNDGKERLMSNRKYKNTFLTLSLKLIKTFPLTIWHNFHVFVDSANNATETKRIVINNWDNIILTHWEI